MVRGKKPASDINVDNILYNLKSFGFYQISQFLLISSMVISVNSNVFIIVFAGKHIDYKCKNLTDQQLDNLTKVDSKSHVVYETCSIKVYSDANDTSSTESLKCLNGYEYTQTGMSFISEWDLVCDKNGLAELTQTCFIIGQCLGGLIFPVLTEKFGRRPMHITCGFCLMLAALMCALSPKFWVFILARIFSGIFEEGCVISGVTAICELFSTSKRSLMTAVYSLLWSSAMSIPALIAYLISKYGWRVYCFYASATTLFFIIEIFFLEESIRWLFVTGKVIKAKLVIQKACRQNQANFDTVWEAVEKDLGKTVDICTDENAICTITVYIQDGKCTLPQNNFDNSKDDVDSFHQTDKPTEKTKSNIFKVITIFKYPMTRYITLINIFNWLVVNTSYNSIYMLSEDLVGNMYFNFFLMGVMESLAAALYCVGIKRFGHKIPMVSCASLGAVSMLIACFLKIFGDDNSTNGIIFMVLHLFAIFGVGACYGGLYIYTPELYPTDVRSVGLGIASSMSRIGSMVAPFSRILVAYAEWAPSCLFGTGLLLSFIFIICFMPETSNHQLSQTMAELKESRQARKMKAKINQVYTKDVEE